jgi:hypothetical protein
VGSDSYNVYCDESCHLEHDGHPAMVLGALWCPHDKAREIAVRIREIKAKHGLPTNFEIKWSKVSPGKISFYSEIIDYFFDNADLHFRACVANKDGLDHTRFGQDHDTWYYKMYFLTLANILRPKGKFWIFFDRKDSRAGAKLRKLEEVLTNSVFDFRREIVKNVQAVLSHEVEQVQLADLLTGCIGYANRDGSDPESAKSQLVHRVVQRSGYSMTKTTLLREEKFNLFHWSADRG